MSQLEILYRSARFVAVDKPAGMLAHPGGICRDAGPSCMTLLRDELGAWVYPVHRLDRATSGVQLFALDPEAASAASALFREHAVGKTYLAVVRGYLSGEGEIDWPLRKDFEKADSPRVEAQTRYRCLGQVELPLAVGRHSTARYSLIEAEPLTGRRHQIRRHLAHLSHPIVGDTVHGDGRHNRLIRAEFGVQRLLLHSKTLSYRDPFQGLEVRINSLLTNNFIELIDRFFTTKTVGQYCLGHNSQTIT